VCSQWFPVKIEGFEKVWMLRCAASFVIVVYSKVHRIPQDLRALPAELFTKSASVQGFYETFIEQILYHKTILCKQY
jgi:hypothetical protein